MTMCKFSHQYFKDKKQIRDFVLLNQDAIKTHYKSGIITPLNEYAMRQDYFLEEITSQKEKEQKNALMAPDIGNKNLFGNSEDEKSLEDKKEIGDGGSESQESNFELINPFN